LVPAEEFFEGIMSRPLIWNVRGTTAHVTPGINVDKINVAAGLKELIACGYDDPHTRMVIEFALMRWARGEEDAALKAAIDQSFHGIDLTSWYRVLAAAKAAAV
jgi:hypothetical protein